MTASTGSHVGPLRKWTGVLRRSAQTEGSLEPNMRPCSQSTLEARTPRSRRATYLDHCHSSNRAPRWAKDEEKTTTFNSTFLRISCLIEFQRIQIYLGSNFELKI